MRFRNRIHAGEVLGARLASEWMRGAPAGTPLVLGLPRGGVPVASGVAAAVGGELDVVIVRKVGVPGHQELAMGAVATGGFEVRNDDIMRRLGITTETFERVAGRERSELERRTTRYRGDRAQPSLEGRDIVVVDDGIATGASMGVALRSIRTARPGSLWVAVPVAPPSAVEHLATMADGITAVIVDDAFGAVGRWYEDFSQTSDAEVEALLSG